jgi:hypothetical protein
MAYLPDTAANSVQYSDQLRPPSAEPLLPPLRALEVSAPVLCAPLPRANTVAGSVVSQQLFARRYVAGSPERVETQLSRERWHLRRGDVDQLNVDVVSNTCITYTVTSGGAALLLGMLIVTYLRLQTNR